MSISEPQHRPDAAFSLFLVMDAQEEVPFDRLATRPDVLPIGGQLCAVGQWVPWQQGEQDLQQLSSDFVWLSKQAIAHDRAIREVYQYATVLPFKLGTLFSSAEALRAELGPLAAHFREELAAMQGKREWSVKLHHDVVKMRLSAEQYPEVAALEAEMAASPPGKAFLLSRKLAQLKSTLAVSELQLLSQKFFASAKYFAHQVAVARTMSKQLVGRDDEMILHLALLLDEEKEQVLPEWVAHRQRQVAHLGITILTSGPWPPYHFVKNAPEAHAGTP